MIHRILELFTREYEETRNESLLKEINKIKNLIVTQQKKPKDHNLIVHIINDSVYNHEKIMMLKSNNNCGDTHFFLIQDVHYQCLKLKEYDGLNIVILKNNTISIENNVLDLLKNADLVLVQYLYPHYIPILNQIEFKGLLAWMPWGGDYLGYYLNKFFDDIDIEYFKKQGLLIDNQNRTWHIGQKNTFDAFMKKVNILFTNKVAYDYLYQNNNNVIFFDYLFPQSEKYIEKESIKSNYLNKYKQVLDTKTHLTKVMIGNSNKPENNHISAIQKLKDIQDKSNQNFFLTIMLSYGDDEKYKNTIRSFCETFFKDHYFIFENFLELNDLYNLVGMQDIAYMNHIRSQGFGLITICLMLSVNVYMRKNNHSYILCKEFEKNTNMTFDNLYAIEDIDDEMGFSLDKDIEKNSNSLQILRKSFDHSEKRFKFLFF